MRISVLGGKKVLSPFVPERDNLADSILLLPSAGRRSCHRFLFPSRLLTRRLLPTTRAVQALFLFTRTAFAVPLDPTRWTPSRSTSTARKAPSSTSEVHLLGWARRRVGHADVNWSIFDLLLPASELSASNSCHGSATHARVVLESLVHDLLRLELDVSKVLKGGIRGHA